MKIQLCADLKETAANPAFQHKIFLNPENLDELSGNKYNIRPDKQH